MSKNRLDLNFSLKFTDERADFIRNYMQSPQFQSYPPTDKELETMGNYILWGKNRDTNLNAKQEKFIQLTSKSGDWDSSNHTESLEALMESPTFTEAQFKTSADPISKMPREVFSRTKALEQCPEEMRPTFEQLFREIDTLELKINYYELAHGKRKNPPREQLLNKFSSEEREAAYNVIVNWNQYNYLKKRHELIELRRQQYALRDSFVQKIQQTTYETFKVAPVEIDFGAGIKVLPLGIRDGSDVSQLVFRSQERLNPNEYKDEDLKKISKLIWEDANAAAIKTIDLSNEEHLYQIFQEFNELENSGMEDNAWENNTNYLMKTIKYYVKFADLGDLQLEILKKKIAKVRNYDIAKEINEKWKKAYTPNYISTIFKQRIIPKICEAVNYHLEVVRNLCFEEEFKRCTCCGKMLLKSERNFTHKGRAADGFTARCKKCEKESRDKKKIGG